MTLCAKHKVTNLVRDEQSQNPALEFVTSFCERGRAVRIDPGVEPKSSILRKSSETEQVGVLGRRQGARKDPNRETGRP